MDKKKKVLIRFLLFLVFLVLMTALLWSPYHMIASDTASLRSFLQGLGGLAIPVFILLTALQVIFAPIPGQLIGFASGYLFGPVSGTIYSMAGLILGSTIVFLLSRKYGRPFIELFIDPKLIKKLDEKVQKHGVPALFMIYLLPGLPDDALCFVAGLTKIPVLTLIVISAIGRLPGFIVLNFTGGMFASEDVTLAWSVFIIAMLLSLIGYLYKKRIEDIMVRIASKFSKRK